ncbi:MAG TPA: MFS transporter, partial [Acidimicrobiales bacterium]|nr:MFS transporter [Acidimicrobiales bacterium]
GLVEAGSRGWSSSLALASLIGGGGLIGFFVHHESRAAEPILPLRLLTHSTRSAANLARGLLYAGMYGMAFFLTQFLQDVQRFTPLVAGVAFLPMPTSVFLFSQLTARVLLRRFPQKSLMMVGATVVTMGLLFATRINSSTSYAQVLVSMVLVGMGMGISFVSFTSASLADVPPEDAGAASGLVNMSQQLGAAVGLAVLVTAFDAATRHVVLGAQHVTQAGAIAHANAILVHGLDNVFALSAVFGAAALATVVFGVRSLAQSAPAPVVEIERADEEVPWLQNEAG